MPKELIQFLAAGALFAGSASAVVLTLALPAPGWATAQVETARARPAPVRWEPVPLPTPLAGAPTPSAAPEAEVVAAETPATTTPEVRADELVPPPSPALATRRNPPSKDPAALGDAGASRVLAAAPAPNTAAAEVAAPGTPSRTITVSLAERRLVVAEGGAVVREITDLSFGPGRSTPVVEDGRLSTSRRIRNYRSRKYNGAPMPHALFLEEHPAIAFHAGNTRTKSHGCIRLTPEDAAWLFAWAGREPVRVDIRRS